MSSIVKVSEAASLAMHTMVLLAKEPDRIFTTKEISSGLNASKDHLSKVLQRLEKSGLVKSTRGPRGGFMIGKNKNNITLLDIYETIEGTFVPARCLLEKPVCLCKTCIFGGFEKVNKDIMDYLSGSRLSDLSG